MMFANSTQPIRFSKGPNPCVGAHGFLLQAALCKIEISKPNPTRHKPNPTHPFFERANPTHGLEPMGFGFKQHCAKSKVLKPNPRQTQPNPSVYRKVQTQPNPWVGVHGPHGFLGPICTVLTLPLENEHKIQSFP